jgi:hypothetical protein
MTKGFYRAPIQICIRVQICVSIDLHGFSLGESLPLSQNMAVIKIPLEKPSWEGPSELPSNRVYFTGRAVPFICKVWPIL